jgi:hypothetical protein
MPLLFNRLSMKRRPGISRSLGGAFLLAATLSGCGAGSLEMMFINPGSFDYLSCAELAAAAKTTSKREQELKELIDRAEEESVGVVVAAATYRSDYLKARGEQQLLAETAQKKNCENQPKR